METINNHNQKQATRNKNHKRDITITVGVSFALSDDDHLALMMDHRGSEKYKTHPLFLIQRGEFCTCLKVTDDGHLGSEAQNSPLYIRNKEEFCTF